VASLALSAVAASGPALDWSVEDRLTGPVSIDPAAAVEPLAIDVEVGGDCLAEPAFALDGRRIAVRDRGGCRFALPPMTPGTHRLDVSDDETSVAAQLDVRDHLVVSIGDSVASGEGNPDGAGPSWLERRCHRSLRSGAAVAARAVELGDRHSVITLVPLACSGATIDRGLLGAYGGIEEDPRRGPLEPQVDVALGLERPIEALLLSVGANDVHFGALVRFCSATRNCADRRFDPRHPGGESDDVAAPTAAQVTQGSLEQLARGYDALARRLAGRVEPQRVIAVEYFDPLRDAQGAICEHALPGVSLDEARWAEANVLAPLNAELRAAAARHGWRIVGGVTEAFRRHGICAGTRAWIRRPVESALGQLALSGTLHPNGDGHVATGALIAPVLASTLATADAPTLPVPSHEGYVRWWWLILAGVGGAAAVVAAVLLRGRRTGS